MQTIGWVLILIGLVAIRGLVKGRTVQETVTDAGDLFIAAVQTDNKSLAEVMARKGSSLDFTTAAAMTDAGSKAAGEPMPGEFGTIVDLGKYAQSLGLAVREHPAFDPVDPVHTQGSDHYKNTTGTGGDAIDVSGGTETAKIQFAKKAKDSGFYVLFNRPGFTNWPGHDTHVHVSDRRKK